MPFVKAVSCICYLQGIRKHCVYAIHKGSVVYMLGIHKGGQLGSLVDQGGNGRSSLCSNLEHMLVLSSFLTCTSLC